MDEKTVGEAVAGFDGWLRMRRSEGTRLKYASLLRPFVEMFEGRALGTITASEIELQHLSRYAGLSPATQRNHFAALRSLFECAERLEWVERNPMRKLEVPKKVEEFKGFLSQQEDADVQDVCRTQQERALVWTLRYTGLRVSEALALTWADVDLHGGRLLPTTPALQVVKSKTDAGRRIVPIPPLLAITLKAWRELHPSTVYVFETKNGTRMSPQFAHRLVVRVGKRAGVKLSPHSLRRQYGSVALNAGARIEAVSAALGHANTSITHKSYARLEKEQLAAEMMAVMGG